MSEDKYQAAAAKLGFTLSPEQLDRLRRHNVTPEEWAAACRSVPKIKAALLQHVQEFSKKASDV